MAFLGLDDILVLEKDKGTVQRIVNGQILLEPLLDVNVANTGEGGMLGIDIANPDDEFDRPSWCSSTIPVYCRPPNPPVVIYYYPAILSIGQPLKLVYNTHIIIFFYSSSCALVLKSLCLFCS
jgi:hypothetical protein